jgi:S-adenosylhomocysteine hydrolase
MSSAIKKSESDFNCKISDNIILGLKDATLCRTITYKNLSTLDFPINLSGKQFYFPYQCEDFLIEIKGKKIEPTVKENNSTQVITISAPKIQLKSKKEFTFKIDCKWRDIYNLLQDLHFTFKNDDTADYSLKIVNYSLSKVNYILEINGDEAVQGTDYVDLGNSIQINEISAVDEEIRVNLFSITTPRTLSILEAVKVKGDASKVFSKFTIIIIQHLLSDVIHLINAFFEMGAEKESIFIVGIPYSTKHQTVKYLRKKKYNNIETPDKYPFTDVIRKVMINAISHSKEKSKKILIIEDGGYVVPLLHKKKYFEKDYKLFIGAVEQTANGIWRDRDLKEKNKIDIKIPIINVAESRIKQKLESPLIGRAVSKNIELIYNKTFREVAGEEIGLVGYGSIGREVAKNLKSLGAIVSVYDNDNLNKVEAKYNGFRTFDTIPELIKNCKIIIEATGRTWTDDAVENAKIISEFKHGSYFVSASSKRMGIDYNEFPSWVNPKEIINIPGIGIKCKLHNANESEITLIAGGFPINFFLGESVPDLAIAFILAWLYKCAEILAIKYQKIKPGIIDTNDKNDKFGFFKQQNIIASYHELGIV